MQILSVSQYFSLVSCQQGNYYIIAYYGFWIMSRVSQCAIKEMINSTTSEELWGRKWSCLREWSLITVFNRISFVWQLGKKLAGSASMSSPGLEYSQFIIPWQRLLVLLAFIKKSRISLTAFAKMIQDANQWIGLFRFSDVCMCVWV